MNPATFTMLVFAGSMAAGCLGALTGLGGGVVGAYHVLGLAGAALWLGVSRSTWRHGPPEYTQSGPVPLHSEPADHGHHGARP
jgi:hypothetical protein